MKVYKSSLISFFGNYVLCCFVIVFLALLFAEFGLLFTFSPKTVSEFIPSVFVLLGVLVIVMLLEEPLIEKTTKSYKLTEEELIMEEGIIRKRRLAIPLKNIADISMEKDAIGRIFGFGNVIVKGMKTKINIKGIKNPESVYETIKDKTNKALKGGE